MLYNKTSFFGITLTVALNANMAPTERNHNTDLRGRESSDLVSDLELLVNTARQEDTAETGITAAAAQAQSSETASGAGSIQEQPTVTRRSRSSGDGALWRLSKSGVIEEQKNGNIFDPPSDSPSRPCASNAQALAMSSQRSRQPRNGGRGDSNDEQLHKEMWDEVKRLVGALKTGEITAAQHHEKIFAHEEKLNAKKNTPEGTL